MKSFRRRILALLLALALCTGLAAGAWASESASELPEEEAVSSWDECEADEESAAESAAEDEDAAARTAEGAAESEGQAESEAESVSAQASSSGESNPDTSSGEGGADSSSGSGEQLPDVKADKNLISAKEAFVSLGNSKTLKLKKQPQSPARFVSKNPKVVSVRETGKAMVVKAEGVGKAVVEMRRAADDALLDTVTVYGFRPSTTSQEPGTRYSPGDLTVENPVAPTRTFKLVCQKGERDKSYHKFLTSSGCTYCSTATVAQAFGNPKMTVDWMMTGGREEVALRSGSTLKSETLGYYGLQQMLEYGGVSCKIYNWKNSSTANMEAAKERVVKALSEGRPILLFVDKNSWNGHGPLCVEMHCLTLVGIDKDGYLQIINSTYPQKISYFKNGQEKLTPGELLDHFVRHTPSKTRRKKKDDFYYTKYGGLHTLLEVTCTAAKVPKRTSIKKMSAKLAKTKFVYTGSSLKPKVTLGSLKEGEDFRVHYSSNKNAGTATATLVGLNGYEGMSKLKFTIRQAKGGITASNKTVKSKAEAQKVKLGASAKFGAKITYESSDSQVKVNSSGVVTVPANYAGEVTITLTSAKTGNYTSATKQVTLTVKADLLVKDLEVQQSSKQRKVSLNASSTSGAQISYKSLDKKISVDSSGVVTIPENYTGIARVSVTAAQTETTPAATRKVRITVVPNKPRLASVKAVKGRKVKVKWQKVKGVSWYDVSYTCGGKTKTKKVKGSSVTLRGLKKKKTCVVKVRCRVKNSAGTVTSDWSGKKKVKVRAK